MLKLHTAQDTNPKIITKMVAMTTQWLVALVVGSILYQLLLAMLSPGTQQEKMLVVSLAVSILRQLSL